MPSTTDIKPVSFDITHFVLRVLKYFLNGAVIALVAYSIPKQKIDLVEILTIAVSAGSIFAILDVFLPDIGAAARFGTGTGIGWGIATNPAQFL